MPTIEIIDGIKINLYPNEHLPPHFHAIYGEYEALILISNIEIEKGELPNNQYKKIKKWALKNQNFLNDLFIQFNPDLK
jgi:hypothetical protein